MLIIRADARFTLGILVEYADTAIRSHIISSNRHLIPVCGNIHIHTFKVQRCDLEVERLIIYDGVGLTAGGSADIIYGAVFIDLAGSHRCRTGIAMVIAGEVEVDSRCVTSRRQILHIGLTTAGGVCIVGRHMGDQHLPLAGGLCSILLQPLCELLQGVLVRGMVQHCNVNIATLHRVPGRGNAKHALSCNGIVAAVVCLVVADHMENIRVMDAVQLKQLQRILPLLVVTNVVHRITQLNTEMILSGQLCCDASHAFQRSFLLNVCQQEELRLLLGSRNSKALNIGPNGTVANAIIIGLSCSQPSQGNIVHTVNLVARRIGDHPAGAFHLRCIAQILSSGEFHHCLAGAVGRIRHPGDVLPVRRLSEVVSDIIRRPGFIAHCVIAVKGDLERAVSIFIRCTQAYVALRGSQTADINLSVFIGGAQQLIVGVYADASSRRAVFHIGNACKRFAAYYSGIRLDAIGCFNGIVGYRRCKTRGILVQIVDIQILRLLAAVRALCHLHVQAAALSDRGGNVHNNRCQLIRCKYRVVNGGNGDGHNTLRAVVIPGSSHALGEDHVGDRIASGYGHIGRHRSDAGKVITGQSNVPRLPHIGLARCLQGHAGQISLLSIYGKVTGLTGYVAITVLQIEGDGMQTVAKMHQAGGAAQVIPVILAAVRTVEVEVSRLHAGGVRIGLFTIVISNMETEICCVKGRSVLQLRLGAVVVDQLNGVDRRRSDILIVCTVDNAQVIQQDIALQVILVQLGAIGGVPADAAGSYHGAEQHAAVDADHCTGILGQICLQVLPTGFQSLARACAAAAEVYIRIGPAAAAVGAGCNLCTQPGHRHAFGNIHPNADGSGRTINRKVISKTKAGAIGAAKIGPVIFQLNGIMAKANNIGIFFVGIGNHRALYHTASSGIVKSRHRIGCHTVKALNRIANGRIIPGILIAAIEDHGRLHTDVYGNGCRQIPASRSNGRTAGILNIAGCGKHVACKGTRIRIGDAPVDIAVLQLHRLRLVGCLKAQIADLVIVEVYFTGIELQLIRVLNMNHSGAHSFTAADQIHGHIAGCSRGGKHCRSRAAVYGGIAYRAHAVVTYREYSVFRQAAGCCAGVIHGAGLQIHCGIRGVISIVRRDRSMVKLTGSRHVRDHQNCTGYHTLAAASGSIPHGQIRFALTLRNVRGGTTLVQLNSRDAAQCHQHIRFFLCSITNRSGRHGAVRLEQHYSAVLLHAYRSTRIVAAVARLGDDYFSVPYHCNQSIYSLYNLNRCALLLALICLGLCQGGAFSKYVDRAVVKGRQIGAAGVVVMYHAVHHQVAGRLAGIDVEPGGVDTADNVQASLFFIDMSLVGRGLQRPAFFLGVAVAVASDDRCATIAGVDFHDVGNGLGVAGIVVCSDNPLGDIGGDRIIFHRCDMVIGAGDFASLADLRCLSLRVSVVFFCKSKHGE